MLRVTATLALVSALVGCAPAAPEALVDVREATPETLEPGDVLHLLGWGFPAGRVARVRLVGSVCRPGEGAREVELEAPSRAATSDRVDVPVGGELAGGTFHGDVRVTFDGRAGVVTGSVRDVRLVVARPATGDARVDASRARASGSLRRFLGLALDDEADSGGGARVVSVRPGGPASDAGLLAGDVIAAVDGAALAGPDDLLATPGARTVSLDVRRDGHTTTVALALEGLAGEPPAVATTLAIALAVLGLFVLAWLTPLARAADALRRRAESLLAPAPIRADAPLAAVCAALFAGLAAAGIAARVDVVGLAVAAAAARVLARVAAGAARSPRAVARVSLRAVAGLGAAAALVAPLGTSALGGVLAAQSGLLRLGALRGPFQLACAVAVVEALVVSEAPRPSRRTPGVRVLDALATALAVTVVVAGALGCGAPLHGVTRIVLAAATGGALAWAASRWRGEHAMPDVLAVSLGALAPLATVAALALAPRLLDDPLLARATPAAVLLTLVALLIAGIRARVSQRTGPRWELAKFL